MIPNFNTPITALVDGGYLAWKFGAVGRVAWLAERHKYIMKSGALLCVDSDDSFRKDFDPGYKAHRAERKAKREEIFERVKQFKGILQEDPSVRKLEISGLEADDLVTYIGELYHLPIIGRDKDLLQRNIHLMDTLGTEITLEHFTRKLPKAVKLNSRDQILLILCLLGDKSDDIPRLIPPRRLDVLNNILNSQNPYTIAYELYGSDLVYNYYLASLPGPGIYDPMPEPLEYFQQSTRGTFKGRVRDDLLQELTNLEKLLP